MTRSAVDVLICVDLLCVKGGQATDPLMRHGPIISRTVTMLQRPRCLWIAGSAPRSTNSPGRPIPQAPSINYPRIKNDRGDALIAQFTLAEAEPDRDAAMQGDPGDPQPSGQLRLAGVTELDRPHPRRHQRLRPLQPRTAAVRVDRADELIGRTRGIQEGWSFLNASGSASGPAIGLWIEKAVRSLDYLNSGLRRRPPRSRYAYYRYIPTSFVAFPPIIERPGKPSVAVRASVIVS